MVESGLALCCEWDQAGGVGANCPTKGTKFKVRIAPACKKTNVYYHPHQSVGTAAGASQYEPPVVLNFCFDLRCGLGLSMASRHQKWNGCLRLGSRWAWAAASRPHVLERSPQHQSRDGGVGQTGKETMKDPIPAGSPSASTKPGRKVLRR